MKKLLILSILVSMSFVHANDVEVMKLLKTAMSSRVAIQKATKAYLYLGNGISKTKTKKEMKKSLELFDKKFKILEESLNDKEILNLLEFIKYNREDLEEKLKEKYNLDTAQEIIDLGEIISEAELSVAENIKTKLSKKVPSFKGQRYYATQISKYYIAYRAGIKDTNTIEKMNITVNKLTSLIKDMKAYQGNTPEMNKLMKDIDRRWRIIKNFYLNIEKGDLPLIVYETTSKLAKDFNKYAVALIKSKKK